MNQYQKRNSFLELWRFLAAIMIASYHFEWLYIGSPVYLVHFYIWVEFFFILSGFFLAQNAIKKTKNDEFGTIKYVAKQFVKFYPLYLTAFLTSFLIINSTAKNPLRDYPRLFWEAKWEALLCTMTGYDNLATFYNAGGAPAYISSLLICSLFLHYIIKHHKNAYVNVIGPVIIIWGLSRLINYYGNLSQWMAIDSLGINVGIIRGLADMSVGAVGGLLVQSGSEYQFTEVSPKGKKMLSILGFLSLILTTIFLIIFRNMIDFGDLIFFVFVFALGIILLNLGYTGRDSLINKVFLFAGKLSYPIFLFHYCVLIWLKNYIPGLNYRKGLLITLCITLGISIVTVFFSSAIPKRKFDIPKKESQ